jgi:hypothetical protein
MQRHRRLPTSFWKQDVTALIAVAIYIVLAFSVVQAWSFLSEAANAFDTNVAQAPVPRTMNMRALSAQDSDRATSTVDSASPDPNTQHRGMIACGAIASDCEMLGTMLPE